MRAMKSVKWLLNPRSDRRPKAECANAAGVVSGASAHQCLCITQTKVQAIFEQSGLANRRFAATHKQ
jgi:hypothetical protein